MSTSLIKSALTKNPLATQMSIDAWVNDQGMRGENVLLYRDYADGNHRGDLTPEMADLLRIGGGSTARVGDTTVLSSTIRGSERTRDQQAPFNLNRMDNIIQTMVDRLEIKRIEDTSGAANDWLLDVQKCNRFDALQIEVHEAAIRDADTYVLVTYDDKKKEVRFTHEPAYDGVSGMLVMYQKRSRSEIACAIKVWHITSVEGDIADTMRVNVYYPDRCEKFISKGNQALDIFKDADDPTTIDGIAKWVDRAGQPLGVPVIHFKNKAQAYDNYGRSEIDDAIPGQDALNRLMYSMVATAELGGFPVRVAKGFTPPAGLTPGAWVVIGGDGLQKEDVADASTMEQGVITPYLEGMNFIIEQVDEITRTPNPKLAGDSASGESLKQREIGLLGKIKRCHIGFGNSWEDVYTLAHAVQTAYGEAPPPFEYFDVNWRSAEIRNTAEIVKTALELRSLIGDEATIRMIANEYDWTEDQINKILSDRKTEQEQRNQDMMKMGYANFGRPDTTTPAQPPMNGNGQQQGVAA